jgi:hypothetical protein
MHTDWIDVLELLQDILTDLGFENLDDDNGDFDFERLQEILQTEVNITLRPKKVE